MNLDLIRESVVVDYNTVSGTNAECMHSPVYCKAEKEQFETASLSGTKQNDSENTFLL